MKRLIFLLFAALAPVACEYTTDSLSLPYQERLVVEGQIYGDPSGGGYVYAQVGKTLPLTANVSDYGQILLTGKVLLSYADTTIELGYDPHILAFSNNSIAVSSGTTCTLKVESENKRAWASTRIPYPVHIDTVTLEREIAGSSVVYSARAEITPHPDEVYLPGWIVFNKGNAIREIIRTEGPLRLEDASADGGIHVAFVFQTDSSFDSVRFNCTAYDKPYYDYYISRGNPEFSGIPIYSYFEGPVRWNVQGDAVGLFVGSSSGSRIVYPH